jgi:hypothetical protein
MQNNVGGKAMKWLMGVAVGENQDGQLSNRGRIALEETAQCIKSDVGDKASIWIIENSAADIASQTAAVLCEALGISKFHIWGSADGEDSYHPRYLWEILKMIKQRETSDAVIVLSKGPVLRILPRFYANKVLRIGDRTEFELGDIKPGRGWALNILNCTLKQYGA